MNLIQPWRQLYGIKQAVLAREAGIHAVSLSRIENGAEPSVTNALKVCEGLSRISGRDIRIEHVFSHSEEGADLAWDALSTAEDDAYRAMERVPLARFGGGRTSHGPS